MAEEKENKKIEHVVHQIIRLNDVRIFARLKKENEAAIVRAIQEKRRTEFLDTLSKRDHYISKLNRIANSSISDDQTSNYINVIQEQPKSHTIKYKGLESRYISNLYHAIRYIDNVVSKDEELVSKIRKLIEKHVHFQMERKSIRQSINSLSMRGSVVTLSKVANVNSERSKKDIERRQKELKNALMASDDDTMKVMKSYYQESLHLFHIWQIPLFCIAEYLEYPGIEDHKSQLLNYLMSKFHDHRKI